jgi:hypothetical protein
MDPVNQVSFVTAICIVISDGKRIHESMDFQRA